MAEPIREFERALTGIDDRWDEARTERTLEGLHDKLRRRSSRRRALALSAGAGCAVAVLAVVFWQPPAERPTLPVSSPQPMASNSEAPDSLHMKLADGSEISLRDAHTRVTLTRSSTAAVDLDMSEGQARFDVMHREHRVFQVQCGEVVIKVLGTSFELERDGARTRVSVLRGRVAVAWSTGQTELSAGEAAWFPRASGSSAPLTSVEPAQRNPKRAMRRASPVHSAWREPAEQGDFERAYELLARAPQPVADDVEELLLAADTARLSGHPEAALPFLKRVIAQHANDSRAPLAAFTLGGVLMQQLGQPREAEAAYARARELSLNPSLSEDALARQVEAAYRAGDSSHARALAEAYLARYPKGRRVHAVQRFGGL
jgi:transmembrane sensor